MSSNQGKELRKRKVKEGFTTGFPNPSLTEITERDAKYASVTDDVERKLSNLARTQQVVDQETQNYLQVASRDSKYLNQVVKTTDGTLGYVTKQGFFKAFNSQEDADATMGRNGCPSGVTQLDTGSTTYTADGKYVNGDVPLYVGTPMVRGQQCGFAGTNIFVGKTDAGSGKTNYLGCKSGSQGMTATGFKMPIVTPDCPAGTFKCPNQGKDGKGFCYDPRRDQMVSTYMVPPYDAPIGSTSGNAPYLAADGVTYLWSRSGGFDGSCGAKPTMPPCPAGTAPCPTMGNGYCWDPTHNMMVTTIDPNGAVSQNTFMPSYMALVPGSAFTYNELKDPFVYTTENDARKNSLQSWYPDQQFTNPNYVARNKIYYQFKAAAAAMMPHLENGQSGSLTVASGPNVISWNMQPWTGNKVSGSVNINGRWFFGNVKISNARYPNGQLVPSLFVQQDGNTLFLRSPAPSWWSNSYQFYFDQNPETIFKSKSGGGFNSNGATFTVIKRSNTTADATLTFGDRSMTVSYTFATEFRPYQKPILSQDGGTKLWKKQMGYNSACGAQPTVPPTLTGSELLTTCKSIASSGGFGVYGIMDGECYVGANADSMSGANGCVSIEGGEVGENGSMAVYKNEGASNAGMFKYGFVTADETLREYPANLKRPSDKFNSLGRRQILKSPSSKVIDKVSSSSQCQNDCIGQLGDNCEAYGYNTQTQSCTLYGKDSLSKGLIVPVGESNLMVRQTELNNDESCPKDFTTVSSSVWRNLPNAGMMSDTVQCDLGYVTKTSRAEQQQALAELGQSLSVMQGVVDQDVSSDKQMMPKFDKNISELKETVKEYKKLYEGMTNISDVLLKEQNEQGSFTRGSMTDYLLMGATALFAGAALIKK